MTGPWEQFAAPSAPPPAPPDDGPWKQFAGGAAPAATGAAAIPTEADALSRGVLPGGRPNPGPPVPATAPRPAPTFTEKITGAVEAALNAATSFVGGTVGMTGGFIGGMAGNIATGQYGTPEGARNVEQAAEEGAQGVTAGLKRLVHGPMDLRQPDVPDTPMGQQYTEDVVNPAMAAMAPMLGHMPEMGMAHELAKPVGEQVATKVAPTVRAAAAATERGVGKAAAKVLNVDPELAKVAQVANSLKYPIEVAPDQLVENAKFSKLAGQAARDVPLSGSKTVPNQVAFTRNLIDLLNPEEAKAERLTPEVFDQAMRRSGEGIGEITARTPVPESDIAQGLQGVRDGLSKATPDNQRIVNSYIDDIRAAAEEGGGQIDGTRLKEINSEIGKQARSNADSDLGRYLNDLQDTIQESVERNAAPEDIQPLRDFRRQYAYGKMVEPLVAKTIDGKISPQGLMARVTATKQGKHFMARAMGGPIGDLAKVGQLIKEPGTSLTAERGAVYTALAGAAHFEPHTAAGIYGAANLYNRGGAKLTRAMVGKRPPKPEPPAPPEPPGPPPEPTTSPGAGGGGGGGGEPSPGPLGDLTPDWETTPGAGGGPPRGGHEPGLVRPVDEPSPTTGNRKAPLEIPAVPGRPDLPDTMVAGGPAEVAATGRSNAAMLDEHAALARRMQELDAEMRRTPEKVPAGEVVPNEAPLPTGKVIEGQPEIKPELPKKALPVGKAAELPVERIEPKEPIPEGEVVPLTPEQEAAWRKEFGLGGGDAERAKAVAQALKHDEPAVEAAAKQHENSPRAFDREIARINEEAKNANESQRAAEGSESPVAAAAGEPIATGKPEPDAAATARAVDEQPGTNGAPTADAGGEPAAAGGQAPVGEAKPGDVAIREVPGGFEAHRDGKKIGYLKDNLERGQAKQLGENANVDMVKVDKEEQGKGVGRALYDAFDKKHEGRIMPSGKTEPSAWKLWKRNYPEKVDAFVEQEAQRIRDGADPKIVAGNITDPEVRSRVLKESEPEPTPPAPKKAFVPKQQGADSGKRLQPNDLQPAAGQEAPKKGAAPEPPEEVFSTEKAAPFYSPLEHAVSDLKLGKASAEQWTNTIKSLKGIKAEEIEWSGVNDWLKAKGGSVTKAELQAFLKDGGVKVQEVTKGGHGSLPDELEAHYRGDNDLLPVNAREWLRTAEDFETAAKGWQEQGNKTKADKFFKLAEQANEMAEHFETDSGRGRNMPKYSQYQLPGGKNYREVLLTLPAKSIDATGWTAHELRPKSPITGKPEYQILDKDGNVVQVVRTAANEGEALQVAQQVANRGQTPGTAPTGNYKSPHWEEPNVLAHIRLNDRVDAEGRKVLFVEEIQSDWAQQGKKKGFGGDKEKLRAQLDQMKQEQKAAWTERDGIIRAMTKRMKDFREANPDADVISRDLQQQRDRDMDRIAELETKYKELQPQIYDLGYKVTKSDTVPSGPFVGKTDAWTGLAIKRIAKMAADEGYDRVAFVNGEQSAERYDLSKQVDRIDYSKNGDGTYNMSVVKDGSEVFSKESMSPDDLADHIGKETAQKMIDGEGTPATEHDAVDRWEPDDSEHNAKDFDYEKTQPKTLAGLDLKVGGEGMKAFYDKIVPNVAKDVVRKLGGDGLTSVDLPNPHRPSGSGNTLAEAGAARARAEAEWKPTISQPGFDITDKMREQAAGGVPLFKGDANKYGSKPLGSPEATEAVLRDKFGSKLIDGLLDQGLLKYALARDEGMTNAAGRGGVKAVFRQKSGEQPAATLYFDRLTAEQAPAMLMHELGEHFGAPRMLGPERYALVMDELKELAKTDPEVKDAWQHVERNYIGEGTPDNVKLGDDTFMREVAAHLVETQPDLPWVRRFINEIRAFFYEQFGTTMGNRVDANLIRGMAASALRKASAGKLAGQRPAARQFKPFVPSRTAMTSTNRPPIQ